MTYLDRNASLVRGYNPYIEADKDDMGTQMDVGLLVMEPGDTYRIQEGEKETAVLLFSGEVTFRWNDLTVRGVRPDCFRQEAYCLLAPRKTVITLEAHSHSELYIQKTVNDRDYTPVMYTP